MTATPEPAAPAHAHSHAGGHAHSHAPAAAALATDSRARRALAIALVVGSVVLVAEVIAGVLFHSLALLGDAAHMATDVGSYAIALWAARVAARPASPTRTFGSGKAEILAALANGATLLAATAWIVIEAVRRLFDPSTVEAGGMTVVAAGGLIANVIVLTVLMRAQSNSLNMRGAKLHAAGDLLGSIAALGAGIVIATTGWDRADPIASLLLSGLIVFGAWRLVRASTDQLLDTAPRGRDADVVGEALVAVDSVLEVHDVHVWSISPGVAAASAHVRISSSRPADVILADLQRTLREGFQIEHSTLQLQADRGAVPLEAVPLMSLEDAVEWTTEHVARAHPDLSRAVIAAAAGAAAIGLAGPDRVSPVTLSSRTLTSLHRRPGESPPDA